jgi:lysozyme
MSINGITQGIDISAAQKGIDFGWVKNQGFDFVWTEATIGNDKPDPDYDEFVAGTQAEDLVPGAYIFFYPLADDPNHPGRSPEDQVNAAFKMTQGLGAKPGELPFMIDIEWPPPTDWSKWKDTAPLIRDKCISALERIKLLWGRTPVIYTEPWFWKSMLVAGDCGYFKDFPLFIAGSAPVILEPWSDWTFWQQTGSEVYPKGCGKTDRDVFNGTSEQFAALINAP